MPDIKAALYSYLSTEPTITALVGDQIYAEWASPTTVEPYIIMTRLDASDFGAHLGGATDNLESSLQLDIWAATSLAVETIAETLRQRLDGFHGTMGSEHIYSMRLTSVFDGPLSPDDGGNTGRARATVSFDAWHT